FAVEPDGLAEAIEGALAMDADVRQRRRRRDAQVDADVVAADGVDLDPDALAFDVVLDRPGAVARHPLLAELARTAGGPRLADAVGAAVHAAARPADRPADDEADEAEIAGDPEDDSEQLRRGHRARVSRPPCGHLCGGHPGCRRGFTRLLQARN